MSPESVKKMSPIPDDLFLINQPFGEVLLAAKMSGAESFVWSVVALWIALWTRFIRQSIVHHQFLRAYIVFAQNCCLTAMRSLFLTYLQNLWVVLVAVD